MIRRVFLDIDGVLADFIGAIFSAHGKTFDHATYPPHYWGCLEAIGCTKDEFWKPAEDYEFWRNLPIYPWAEELLRGLEERIGIGNVCLLTSPGPQIGPCVRGKRGWISRNFKRYEKQVLFGGCKHFCANPSTLLIDDSEDNCESFADAGGHWITFPQVWNSGGNRIDPHKYVLTDLDYLLANQEVAV